MKSTTFIAILLTFLMFLLVLISAVVFLWQGQDQLATQINALEVTGTAQTENQVRIEANMGAESAALATHQAVLITRNAEIDSSVQDTIDLQQELNAMTATLAAALELAATATPNPITPTIEFLGLPTQIDESYPLNAPLEFTVLVAHPNGVNTIRVLVNGEPSEEINAGGQILSRVNRVHLLNTPGTTEISIVAITTTGISAEKGFTITVLEPTPTPLPTPAPTTRPLITATPES